MTVHFLERVAALAPADPPNHRATRYKGDDQCVSLAALHEVDRDLVRALYRTLQGLFSLLGNPAEDLEKTRSGLRTFLARCDLKHLTDDVRKLGVRTVTDANRDTVGRAIHDARGGSLAALLFQLARSRPDEESERSLRSIFFYTRDQMKILRNVFLDLDDRHREEDLAFRLHPIRTVIDKLRTGLRFRDAQSVELEVACSYDGDITACCCESAALDRILYNGLHNACRHTADDRVSTSLHPVPDVNGSSLRIVMANRISPEEASALEERERDGRLDFLFESCVSTTGSGLGLAIAGDFVAEAFGLHRRTEALAEGYLGACIAEEHFVLWLHWPIVLKA